MAREFSKSQVDKLGERLRHSESADENDLRLLQAIRAEYDEPMAHVETVLRDLGFRATSRLKTINTIVEKLKRERNRLSTIQDIAGVRIVEDCPLFLQDEIVAAVISALPGTKIQDRRTTPSHGYRAVHLIANVNGFPVEIQVRTKLQDQWAQLFEALADAWGRQIRYGDLPNLPNEKVDSERTRQYVVELLKGTVSEAVEKSESVTNRVANLASPRGWKPSQLRARYELWSLRRLTRRAENGLMKAMGLLMVPIQREIQE